MTSQDWGTSMHICLLSENMLRWQNRIVKWQALFPGEAYILLSSKIKRLHMKYLFTLIAFLFSGIISYSQSNYITAFERDNEGSVSVTVNAGNKLFFSAPDSMHGRELWVTDG